MSLDVFISVGRTSTPQQEAFVRAIEDHLRANGLIPRALGRSDWSSEQPLKFVQQLMRECAGTVIIAFERIHIAKGTEKRGSGEEKALEDAKIPTVWNQIEAGMAYERRHPLLVLVEDDLREEGLLERGYDWWVQRLPLSANALHTPEF